MTSQSRTDAQPVAAAASEIGRPADTPGLLRRLAVGIAWKILPFVPIVVVWELVASLGVFPPYLFPRASAVAGTYLDYSLNGLLWTHIFDSLLRLALGLVVGAGLGLPLGMLMGMNRAVGKFFDPVVTFGQGIPGLAWTPLAILWFGLGSGTVTFIIFLTVFFPILFASVSGVRGIPQVLISAALMLGAGRLQIVREVILPGALPSVITGLRVSFGFGWRALVAAEMIASSTGLGYMIFDARQFLKSDVVIMGMLTIGIVSLILDSTILKPLEVKTIERWGLVRAD